MIVGRKAVEVFTQPQEMLDRLLHGKDVLIPMRNVAKDPRSEVIRRHHLHPQTLGVCRIKAILLPNYEF